MHPRSTQDHAPCTQDHALLSQDFELMNLGPAVTETVGLTASGRDFAATPPAGYSVDRTQMPPGGVPEWSGWTFADRGFWQTEGAQGRANFTKAQGTVAVGDTQEWDDLPQLNNSFNSLFSTSPVSLANVVANTAVLVRLPRCHAPVTMHSCLCKRTNVGAWGKSIASQWELQ